MPVELSFDRTWSSLEKGVESWSTQLNIFYMEEMLNSNFFRLEHSSFAANFENLILGFTMTTLEPKSTSLLSQLKLRKPGTNGQILSRKGSNIDPKAIHMSKDKG